MTIVCVLGTQLWPLSVRCYQYLSTKGCLMYVYKIYHKIIKRTYFRNVIYIIMKIYWRWRMNVELCSVQSYIATQQISRYVLYFFEIYLYVIRKSTVYDLYCGHSCCTVLIRGYKSTHISCNKPCYPFDILLLKINFSLFSVEIYCR